MLFTTRELLQTSTLLTPPPLFLLDTYFPGRHFSEKAAIDLDKVAEDRKVAAYVSPKVAAKAGEKESRRLEEYVPPSVIELDSIDPDDLVARQPGEDFSTPMSPSERHAAILARLRQIHNHRIWRRIILQAAEILLDGQVTVEGPDHPADVINYGRDGSLIISPAVKWDQANAVPIDDLEDASLLIAEAGEGAVATTVTMDTKAWRLFREAEQVKAVLNLQRLAPVNIEVGPTAVGRGARLMGRFGDFDVWVYSDTYIEDGAVKKYLPDYTVILGGADIQGVCAFGAVALKDQGSGQVFLQPGDIVPDMFGSDNPVGEFIRDQSKPLLVPGNVNGCARLTVKA